MSRPIWRRHRAPLPIQPMQTTTRESVGDRLCYAVALISGLMILGRVALHFILEALS